MNRNKTGNVVAMIGLGLSLLLFILNIFNIIRNPNLNMAGFLIVVIIFGLILISGLPKRQKNDDESIEDSEKITEDIIEDITENITEQTVDETSTDTEKETEMQSETEYIDPLINYKRSLAHSVRMPIAIISGYADVIEKDKCTPEAKVEYLHKISQNVKYLKFTYQMMLEEGNDEAELFDVASTVYEFADQISEHVKKKGKRLEIICRQKDIKMLGNPIELMKILYNVIENSLKYMQGGHGIYITIDRSDGNVVIIYRDDGVGINKEEVDRVINAHDDSGGSNQQDARGFGLHMIQGLVAKWNGTMQIKTSEGNGFGVFFFFPESSG